MDAITREQIDPPDIEIAARSRLGRSWLSALAMLSAFAATMIISTTARADCAPPNCSDPPPSGIDVHVSRVTGPLVTPTVTSVLRVIAPAVAPVVAAVCSSDIAFDTLAIGTQIKTMCGTYLPNSVVTVAINGQTAGVKVVGADGHLTITITILGIDRVSVD